MLTLSWNFQEFWFCSWIFQYLFNKIDFGFEILYTFQKSWYWYWLCDRHFKKFDIDIEFFQIFSRILILILNIFCQFQQSWFWYWYFQGISRFLILILKPKSHSCPSQTHRPVIFFSMADLFWFSKKYKNSSLVLWVSS